MAARALDRTPLAVLQQERAILLVVAVDSGLLVVGRLHLVPEAKVIEDGRAEYVHKVHRKCLHKVHNYKV